jgi:PAS domain-containing protein
MQLRREFLVGLGTLVTLNVLFAFGAIGLLLRMSPAIERILQENVYSIEATEEMLSLLVASSRQPSRDVTLQQFEQALQRARNNVTEAEETPVLQTIQQHYRAAIGGDEQAVATVVRALQRLIHINQSAMEATGKEAQRLGFAGAWVAVLVALVSFMISLIVVHKLEERVLNPFVELYRVLQSILAGNPYRRCREIDAPEEIKRVLSSVNLILDERLTGDPADAQKSRAPSHATLERSALMHLLEARSEAMVVVDEHGEVVASNRQGLAVLGSPRGVLVKNLLRDVPSQKSDDQTIEPIPLKGSSGWLCVLHP